MEQNGGRLCSLAVLPSSQGKGIGGKLIEELHNDFKRNNINNSYLFVDKQNQNAISLYQKYGYLRIPDLCIDNTSIIYRNKLI